MEAKTEDIDHSCEGYLYLDYCETPETLVIKFVLMFCDLNNFKVFLVNDDEDESNLSSEHCLPFDYSVIKKEILLKEKKVSCRLPALLHCQEKFWRAGLATVVRTIIKTLHRRQPQEGWHKLLGFRETCLKACSEVSGLTKLCEVDLPAAVIEIEAEQIDLDCVSDVPVALVKLENHLRNPPVLHNLRKQLKQLAKRGKENTVKDCSVSKIYFSGFEFTLADLVLFPSVTSILTVLEQKNHRTLMKIPHIVKWYKEVSSLQRVKEALQKSNLRHPVLECLPINPEDNLESNLADELDFKLMFNEKKKASGTKKIQHMNCKILPPIVERLARNGALPECSKHPCEDMRIQWEVLPSALDPAGGELNPGRAKRKRQQIENMFSVVRTMADDASVIVDFCSGGGHLGIVIAYFLTKCTVIMIENKKESLERARNRIQSLGLENVTLYQCNLDYFTGSFSIGVSLHACGLVTDLVMQQCFKNRASFVICPCCYGGICNTHMTSYPQSSLFANEYKVSYSEYRVLGHAADQTTWNFDSVQSRQGKHCMGLIDLDRVSVAKEHGYEVTLCTMQPYDCTPKNNLLIGYEPGWI